ncbi:MAG: hypothetical protein MASP_01526 [Candidatus Methanolliviera sp. GoM_asphalt]|nr:MAG: hypothetical protein MASP_01526 [Candidatus Methanolliviera sp. GoM_asphalt]
MIEKATSRDELERLCKKYGADLLIFRGEFSLTRVFDVVDRAKAEGMPIALLYISDLDVKGWFMPIAFFRRLNQIYPCPDHAMVRVALTREQAREYSLPPAFDPDDKGYTKGEKQHFYEKSGGRECIELDAVDESVLVGLLEDELKKWAHLEEDQREYDETLQEYEERADEIRENLDLSDLSPEYESIADEFNKLVEEIEDFGREVGNRIQSIEWKKFEFIEKVEARLENEGCCKRYDQMNEGDLL